MLYPKIILVVYYTSFLIAMLSRDKCSIESNLYKIVKIGASPQTREGVVFGEWLKTSCVCQREKHARHQESMLYNFVSPHAGISNLLLWISTSVLQCWNYLSQFDSSCSIIALEVLQGVSTKNLQTSNGCIFFQ